MPVVKTQKKAHTRAITYLSPGEIISSPIQPRTSFSPDSLRELSESIAMYGMLNPLTVRRRMGGYELVAGERRLRAAKLLELSLVPCIVLEVDTEQSLLLAMVENLQREDLDFVEEAQGTARLIRVFGLSQEECAQKLGRSQSAVSNKLRLLKLPEDVLEELRKNGLTERHGRALLRLPGAEAQRRVLSEIVRRGLSVAQSEELVEEVLKQKPDTERTRRRQQFVLKDVRVFLNTMVHGVELMRAGGIAAQVSQQETEEALVLTVSIPKKRQSPPALPQRAEKNR